MVTALYRRYRPETFAEMIGQAQVTEPLMTALRTDRVNHAYLFSGPRGCGKTTSARVLARCLNCAEGPTDTPCGVCPSCVELSRGGGGSLDVVEIDAASHGGVDDARDLRERAIFAPARDRFKIFIIDEAHMVTSGGFNALLKIVEEPPEHVKFIFATTEPDKVLGTIRSRTHHYPFRLIPPGPMLEYVQQLCTEEGVDVAPGVLPLVVRAGGGSPRDTLSLLDQLIAGSEGTTIDYERAVALLGYTHGALLDEVVDAVGARDAAAAFAAVDRVIQTGQDPRRFVEDLLERLRDLIIVGASSPEAAAAVLRGVPEEELGRMAAQARVFGTAELSRVADIVNTALTEMTGASSPRLQLELMLARVLVPAGVPAPDAGAATAPGRAASRPAMDAAGPASAGAPAPTAAPAAASRGAASDAAPAASLAAASAPAPDRAPKPAAAPPSAVPPAGDASAADAAPVRRVPDGPVTAQQIRDAWPEVLAAVQRAKRSAWMVVFTAKVRDYRDDDVLVLAFPSEQDVQAFRGSPGNSVSEILRNAIQEVLGVRVKFVAKPAAAFGDETAAPTAAAPAAPSDAHAAPAAARPGAPETAPATPSTGAAAGPAASGDDSSATASAVGSWATVTIPRDEPEAPEDEAPEHEAPAVRSAPPAASAPAEPKAAEPEPVFDPAPDDDAPWAAIPPPDDEDAPPPDDAPPAAPAPKPAAKAAGARAGRTRAAAAAGDGIQRYGEAVVREVLGATFLEEQQIANRPGFGERA